MIFPTYIWSGFSNIKIIHAHWGGRREGGRGRRRGEKEEGEGEEEEEKQ